MTTARNLLACLTCVTIGFASGVASQEARATEPSTRVARKAAAAEYSRFAKLDTFARALAQIEQHYVRPIDDRELVYAAIDGLTAELDPHSSFLRPRDATMLREDMDGRFGGVGLVVVLAEAAEADDAAEAEDAGSEATPGAEASQCPTAVGEIVLRVEEVIVGGPAHKAGIEAGDEITQIEGRAVSHYADLREAIGIMRGRAGQLVHFQLRHPGEVPRDVEVERAVVVAPAVSHAYYGEGFGSIRLRDFQESSAREIRQALRTLEKEAGGELSGVVLDLRNNGGGLLDQAIAVVDIFVSKGAIVRTRGRGGRLMDEAFATPAGTRRKLPLVVLINKASASASEIVAGALQDHGRALIVGERSYGKGSVQSPFRLGDGSLLKLTIALFYTPGDHMIQASGIKPDIQVGAEAPEYVDSIPDLEPERASEGHLKPEDFSEAPSSAVQEDIDPSLALGPAVRATGEDPQMRRAVEQLVGMKRARGGHSP
jgi:carboxyl-terminal processing protease